MNKRERDLIFEHTVFLYFGIEYNFEVLDPDSDRYLLGEPLRGNSERFPLCKSIGLINRIVPATHL